VPKQIQLVPKRLVYFIYEGILNTRGDHAFFMGAENAKTKIAEKSAETGGHPNLQQKFHVIRDLTHGEQTAPMLFPFYQHHLLYNG
jgi:hypothetical protein